MDVPGEKLLIRMWESLANQGIGCLLKPWQIRREARAHLEARREELLVLAQAEKEIEEIRSGAKRVSSKGNSLKLLPAGAENVDGRAESTRDIGGLLSIAQGAEQAEALRKEVNVAKTILQVEQTFLDDRSQPPDTLIDNDWLYRWRDCASMVSNDDLQSLWAKVLAGELKAPGEYSLRTLEFLKNLSRQEAESIQRLCPFVANRKHIFTYGEMSLQPDVGLDFPLQMQELGLISGVGGLGLSARWKPNAIGPGEFMQALYMGSEAVIARTADANKTFALNMYRVTPLGVQVLALNPMEPPEPYVRAVAEAIKAQGFATSIARLLTVPGAPSMMALGEERPI